MQFMLLLVGDEDAEKDLTEADMAKILEEHAALTERMYGEGAHIYGAALDSAATATTVDVAGGGTITDGPFAETAEQIGGIYFIEADDLDKAIDWAKQIPVSPSLRVEVRPVIDLG